MESKRHIHGGFTFKIEKADNGSFVASIQQQDRRAPKDDVGALYYVIVVILIYGCSILMMIASYIRKNKVDRRLNKYFKEMATVRKREEQLQLFNAAAVAAALQNSGSERRSSDPSGSNKDGSGTKRSASETDKGVSRPGRAVLARHESFILPARSVNSSLRSNRSRNSVRFVNEQSDVDSDNDVFLSPEQEKHLGKTSPKLSPRISPYRARKGFYKSNRFFSRSVDETHNRQLSDTDVLNSDTERLNSESDPFNPFPDFLMKSTQPDSILKLGEPLAQVKESEPLILETDPSEMEENPELKIDSTSAKEEAPPETPGNETGSTPKETDPLLTNPDPSESLEDSLQDSEDTCSFTLMQPPPELRLELADENAEETPRRSLSAYKLDFQVISTV